MPSRLVASEPIDLDGSRLSGTRTTCTLAEPASTRSISSALADDDWTTALHVCVAALYAQDAVHHRPISRELSADVFVTRMHLRFWLPAEASAALQENFCNMSV